MYSVKKSKSYLELNLLIFSLNSSLFIFFMFAFHIFNKSLKLHSNIFFSLFLLKLMILKIQLVKKSFQSFFYRFSAGSTLHFYHPCNFNDRYDKVFLQKYNFRNHHFHTYLHDNKCINE